MENYRNSRHFAAIFVRGYGCASTFGKNGFLGYILGDFFTNSSGHPAAGDHK
jgi:hypothetical protein